MSLPEKRHQLRDALRSLGRRDYASAFALPGAFYHDPDWLQVETDGLFHSQWVCVGREEEVKNEGDYFTYDLAGEALVIVRGLDGSLRALSNVCRHRGTVIAQGSGNATGFLCPYHAWTYDTRGALVRAPNFDDRHDFDFKNCRLPRFACDTWLGFVFVSLAPDPPGLAAPLSPLEDRLGPYHLEQMHLHYLVDETWDVNWKSVVENFMEGYHLSPLHKNTLHKVNPSRLCRHFEPGRTYFGYEVGFTNRVSSERIGHRDLSEERMDTCIMFAVPPGLMVGVGSDYSSFLCIRPDSPTRTGIKLGLIFHGEDWARPDIDKAIKLFQDTMREDKAVLMRVKSGLASRYFEPGPLAPAHLEGAIFDFYRYLDRRLA